MPEPTDWSTAVKVTIQVVIENDEGQVEDVQQVACLRRGPLTPEELGLNLAEARQILHDVQQSMVTSQVRHRFDSRDRKFRRSSQGRR